MWGGCLNFFKLVMLEQYKLGSMELHYLGDDTVVGEPLANPESHIVGRGAPGLALHSLAVRQGDGQGLRLHGRQLRVLLRLQTVP